MATDRIVTQLDDQRVEIGARAAALVVVFTLSVLTGTGAQHPRSLVLLALLAMAATIPVGDRRLRRWRPTVEGFLAGLIVATAQPHDPALLPYFVVPCLSAGLIGGWTLATITAGGTAVALFTRGLFAPVEGPDVEYLLDASQWTLIALGFGLLAAWLRRVQAQRPSDAESYAEAARLLAQLKDLSRQLSGGLDPVGLAQTQLVTIRELVDFDRGWVFTQSTGGLLVLLATDSAEAVDWEPDLDSDSVWSRAWRHHEPHRSNRGFTADPACSLQCSPCGSMSKSLAWSASKGVVRRSAQTRWSSPSAPWIQMRYVSTLP